MQQIIVAINRVQKIVNNAVKDSNGRMIFEAC